MTTRPTESMLASEKRAALERALRARVAASPAYPLSSSQLSIWIQQKLEPASTAYNLPLVFQVKDRLDPRTLQRCIEELARRHPVLRHVFEEVEGEPSQRATATIPALQITDLSHLPESSFREAALTRSHEQANTPFDLRVGPPLRSELIRFAEERHVLLLTIHHLVFDGWSAGVLVSEFMALYGAFRDGKPSPLPPLALAFSDFVRWEQKKLASVRLEAQVEYWRARLAGAPQLLELPSDRPRPSTQTFRGAMLSFGIAPEVVAGLKTVAQARSATLFMTVLSAFYVWLYRLTAQSDLVLGVAVANRDRSELWPLLGAFANTVPMRATLDGAESFAAFLTRVREQALSDYEQTSVPIVKLVEALNPERHPGRSAFFQVGFDLQNSPWPDAAVATALTLIDGETGAAKLDLNLSLSEQLDGSLLAHLEYSTDLFDEATIRSYAAAFQKLLASIVANSSTPLDELDMLTREVCELERGAWQGASVHEQTWQRTLVDLFEQSAERTPDACALQQGQRTLSYREVNARADSLARRLWAVGVRSESRVALHLERSPEQLVALLAILKAGAAYVPLDAALPEERLAFIRSDAQLAAVVTAPTLRGAWPEDELPVLLVCEEQTELTRHHTPPRVADQQAAYVIYTSGSTGRPKGVVGTHAAAVNYALAAREEFALSASDRVLQFASLSFDASLEEIFPCWAAGAALVLRDDDMISTPHALLAACGELGISVLDLPTSYFHELAAVLRGKEAVLPDCIRLIIIGGEQVSAAAVEALAHAGSHVRLLNTYGPTEATVVATWAELAPAHGAATSIGRPVPGVQAFVVDAALRLLPPGVHGEIVLGGAGVARGYLARPDLTAERFVASPFARAPGERLYRTGDRGRRRSDGSLEFVGRLDRQVKVRGFRVELGEVESTLRTHPAVVDCLVLVRDAGTPTARLVAFVAADPRTLSSLELRAWLSTRLPDYMVPSSALVLDALPLTSNGKVDRHALEALVPSTVDLSRSVAAPRTPSEEVMAAIWSEVLELERVGVYDNFFELGGHSLLATRVLSRVRRVMGVDVPLHALFEAPNIARFVQFIEAGRWARQGIAPPAIERSAPLLREGNARFARQSFAQQRLWFLEQLEPGTPSYNLPFALRVTGELNLPALRGALNEIIQRHEALRTVFVQRDDEPVQCILDEVRLDIPCIDLSAHDQPEREVARRVDEEAHRAFDDLARGPLLRMSCLRVAEHEHVLLFTMHHIVSDAWSMGVLVQELAALYRAFCAGAPSPLSDLPLQYADFSAWQHGWLRGERLDAQLAYWRERLHDAPAFLELPTDRACAPGRAQRGASHVLELGAELTRAVRDASRSENVTAFMFLLAAFKTLLLRVTGQRDLVVGTAIANRHREEVEPLIGFFVNTLVLRTDLTDAATFRDALGRVRDTALGAYAHQDLPFERLVEQLAPERQWSGTPLFRVMFVLQNAPMAALELPGATIEPLAIEARTTKFDLTLELIERDDELLVIAQYSADLFERSSIERLLSQYQHLLSEVVRAPATPIMELRWQSDSDRARVLARSEGVREAHGRHGTTLHTRIAEWAKATPDSPAVRDSVRTLSYGELDLRTSRLAARLAQYGVGPDTCVGVLLGRSVALVESVLSVLKLGAAYVPIDPEYPVERKLVMIRSSAMRVVLTDAATLRDVGLPALENVRLVCVDDDAGVIDPQPHLMPEVDEAQTAYVIYTSGSTGVPKGVACSHRGVMNLLDHMTELAPIRAGAPCAGWTSPSFDVSAYELFSTLMAGGCLSWIPESLRLDGPGLSRWLAEQRIESAYVPPFLLADLADCAERRADLCLRRLLVGVEPIEEALLRRLARAIPGLEVINGYGPTEASICATLQPLATLPARDAQDAAKVPIGRPVANTRAYVLDVRGEPVPEGVIGELYLGGAGLAHGYWQCADATAERFVPDHLSDERGARLYKTGDRARYLASGTLEFVGRVDEQIKLRGFRIEPGEIERALLEEAGVRRALVLVREDRPGDRRLVGYVESEQRAALCASELRAALRRKLPEFMVPSALVVLPALPSTVHGKIDRRALPAPAETSSERGHIAPRTELEVALAKIWSEVLGVETLGIEDNFFELGGHSLMATQVISRLRRVLALELPLQALFEEPTISGLALGISEKRWGTRTPLSAALNLTQQASTGAQTSVQSFAQQRLWFLDQLEPGASTYNISCAARLSGPLDVELLQTSLSALVARHDSLRTRFALGEEGPLQVLLDDLPPAFCVADAGDDLTDEEALRARLHEEMRRPFDLSTGPLLRLSVVRLAPEEHVVQLTIHHIVSDGWSLGVLVRELGLIYNARRAGGTAELPALPLRATDFFRQQREWLEQGAWDDQLAYWVGRLKNAPELLALPTDRPRGAEQSSRGATVAAVLPPALAERARVFAREQGATLFMVLLAAFKALLLRHAEQEDIVVGTPVANRNFEELEPLVGHLTNALALRTDLSGDPDFGALLGRVRTSALEAFAHQDVPFEKVVERVGADRRVGKTPIFQVMFVLQNTPAAPLELTEVEATALAVPNSTTMVDLTLEVVEHSFGLVAALQYSTDLFDHSSIERMLKQYELLLDAALRNPKQSLLTLPLLDAVEYEETSGRYAAGAGPTPAPDVLHAMFERQAARTPTATALVVDAVSLSYRELDERANRLAHYLRGQGSGPEQRVGICLARNEHLLVSILGVLKTGAAYVPLDPGYPAERVRHFLSDSQVQIVLCDERGDLLREACALPTVRWERVDQLRSSLAAQPAHAPRVEITPEQLAYVIYTSGSTGRAKGVMIEHRNAATFLGACEHLFDAAELARVVASTSVCFDLSVFELFAPLTRGGTVLLVPSAFDAARLSNATLLNTVPSIMTDLVRFRQLPDGVRTINLAGEALTLGLVQSIRALLPDVRIVNLYGPSEDTTYSTWFEVPQASERAPAVGRALAGTQARVLGADLSPVPFGVAGEIFLGGVGLARGYLDRPDLTAAAFIPDPFAQTAGGRLYRTGDRGRVRPDGQIEYLGRRDAQIKLHGCRIELGEIEALLVRHEAVERAAAIVRKDEGDEPRLVAYVVAKPGREATQVELVAWLRTHLPDYMVPSSVIALDALPTTASGKIDRNALPAPAASQQASVAFTAPETPAEQVLAEIWGTFLSQPSIGSHDNFFALGGHSLLATQILSRVRRVLQVDVPLRRFFEEPTIAGLARAAAELIGGREVLEQVAETYLRVMGLSEASLQELLGRQAQEDQGSP